MGNYLTNAYWALTTFLQIEDTGSRRANKPHKTSHPVGDFSGGKFGKQSTQCDADYEVKDKSWDRSKGGWGGGLHFYKRHSEKQFQEGHRGNNSKKVTHWVKPRRGWRLFVMASWGISMVAWQPQGTSRRPEWLEQGKWDYRREIIKEHFWKICL